MSMDMSTDRGFKEGAEAKQPPKRKEAHFRCPIDSCGRVFNRSYNFKAHMRLHNGDEPYKCHFDDCTERFKWRSSLMNHIRRHQREDTKKATGPLGYLKSISSFDSKVSDVNEEEFYTEVRGISRDSSGKINENTCDEYIVDDNVLFKCPILKYT